MPNKLEQLVGHLCVGFNLNICGNLVPYPLFVLQNTSTDFKTICSQTILSWDAKSPFHNWKRLLFWLLVEDSNFEPSG